MDPFIAHIPDPGADGPLIPISEAAARLGVRTPAIRARLRRGTLKGEYRDGKWSVYADSLPDAGPGTLEADMMAAEVSELELALLRTERDAMAAQLAMATRENESLRRQVGRLEAALAALVSHDLPT